MALFFLFLHILMAFWLVAGVFGGIVVRAQTRRATDLTAKVYGLRLAARLARVYTLPGAVLADGVDQKVLGGPAA